MSVLDKPDLALLAAVPVPLAVFDGTARLIGFNAAYARLTGLEAKWLARAPLWSELAAELRARRQLPEVTDPRAWRDEERRRLTSLAQACEDRLYLPDGRTLARTAVPLEGGGFVLAFEDMTPRLAAERAANEAALVQRQTLDHLGDALAVFGADGRLVFANAAFDRLWQWDGQRLGDFLEMSATPWSLARVLARDSETVRLTRPDGIVLEAQHVPLPDGAALIRFTDISAGARLDEALRERAEAMTSASRMKSEFVATLAHEARKPLSAIAGSARLLTGGHVGELSRRQREYADSIAASAEQLSRMVDDILDLASIEAGMSVLEPQPFDVHAALASLVAAVGERARAGRIALAFDCSPAIGAYEGDERRIRQAVLHLLNNAITYTRSGGRVSLAAKRKREALEILVEDTGVGIARADLTRIQEPFVRAADTDTPGAGLGLNLVRRFVELHGGEVFISSLRNRGTTVLLRLPVTAANG